MKDTHSGEKCLLPKVKGLIGRRRGARVVLRACHILAVMFLFIFGVSAFGDFPPVLVVNGGMSVGTVVSASGGKASTGGTTTVTTEAAATNGVIFNATGNDAKFLVNQNVLLLSGSCCGPVYSVAGEAPALAAPSTGTWDGGYIHQRRKA